ncbi:hypothetical protein IAE57_01330 [Stenotrophomonas sp. S48]|uniref:hypothetical protein n=1 Tax=unclassified Stenotrophomonas TaxID=196198 RepID=UPI00190105B0|nr:MULTISPECIES: hypothetical protein [unclassified Stenotrophomonas]MBK0024792.1 hypothetical protein [Stenotrophomonas sp. S48]MBK0049358.1 hypothetical protein [Stenotrophomonas sp. S49]
METQPSLNQAVLSALAGFHNAAATRCLAAVRFCHRSSPPDDRLSPEQAFDLYARTALESDAQAANALRAARPADAFLSDEMISQLASMVPDIVELVSREAPSRNIPASLAAEYGELMAATYARSRCRATGRDALAASNEVSVSFSCQVPAWDLGSGMLADPVVRQQIRGDDAQAMRLVIEALRSAPSHTYTGSASISGSDATGYFPDGMTMLSLRQVLQSTVPMALLEDDE